MNGFHGRLDKEIEGLKKQAEAVADPAMRQGFLELVDQYELLRTRSPEGSPGSRIKWFAIALWIVMGVAYALGFRLEKPGARFEHIEQRVLALEKGYTEINTGLQTVIRLQCLAMTRHDADLAGACKEYPTRDEPTRR